MSQLCFRARREEGICVPIQDSQDQKVPEEVDDLQQEDGDENQRLDPCGAVTFMSNLVLGNSIAM